MAHFANEHSQAPWSSRLPTMADLRDTTPWKSAPSAQKRLNQYETVIIKPQTGIDLRQVPQTELGLAVITTAKLTTAERGETYIKVRNQQNLIAVDTYKPSARDKILLIESLPIQGRDHATRTYLAMNRDHARGVVHGVQGWSNERLLENIGCNGRKLISAHTIGNSNTALLTFEGLYPPKYVTINWVVTRVYPYRPRSLICGTCLSIGHKSEVCPQKNHLKCCQKCSKEFPPDTEIDGNHQCTPYCKNCDEDHSPLDPSCPARVYADEQHNQGILYRKKRQLLASRPMPRRPNARAPPQSRHYLEIANRYAVLENEYPMLPQKQEETNPPGTDRNAGQDRPRRPPTQKPTHTPGDKLPRTNRRPRARARSLSLPRRSDPFLPPQDDPKSTFTKTQSYREALIKARKNPTICNQARAIAMGIQQRHTQTPKPLIAPPSRNEQHSMNQESMEEADSEANGDLNIPGYQKFTQPSICVTPRKNKKLQPPNTAIAPITTTATYVAKQIPSNQINTDHLNDQNQEIVGIECQPPNQSQPITLFNVYWRPNTKIAKTQWIRDLAQKTKGHRVIIAGDFNSHHPLWGYENTNHNGNTLHNQTAQHKFHLINDVTATTRIGNSVEKDTSPDLCWSNNPTGITWSNTEETLGSDHYILQIEVAQPTTNRKKSDKSKHNLPKATITKWEKVRSDLEKNEPPDNFSAWVKDIAESIKKHTATPTKTEESPSIDRHLLNLWDTRHKLVKKWKKKKTNRNLKKVIQKITEEAENYAQKIADDQWIELCNGFNGQLHTARVWNILNALLDKKKPKHSLEKIKLKQGYTNEELATKLHTLFYPYSAPYNPGPGQTALTDDTRITETQEGSDSPFSKNELLTALYSIKRNTTPGPDSITYTMLKNLPKNYIDALLNQINQAWESGNIPHEWKTAEVIPIPKPGKTPTEITNLRPISLTSCVGKLMEKMVLRRLEWHLHNQGTFHQTMTGFRRHVSTQDTMLRIKQDVYDYPSTAQTRTIIGIDIRKAFDNVSHQAIFDKIAEISPGKRLEAYIRSFLSNRTIRIKIGEYKSEERVITTGVPQGAILSPTLFNIAMKDLPHKLHDITDLQSAVYADDITLWCCSGSPAQQEQTLQEGLDAVHNYIHTLGLSCAPEKTEYVVVLNSNQPQAEKTRDLIQLNLSGHAIPRRKKIRILGFWLDQNGKAHDWVHKTLVQIHQITHMISRVTRKRHGLKEHEIKKIIEAFIISRVMYGLPYYSLTKTQLSKIEISIRKAIRIALGVPKFTPLHLLQATGLMNTLEEKTEIHKIGQIQRLQTSQHGRKILQALGYDITSLPPIPPKPPPWDTIPNIMVRPIPKNMDPERHQERRQERVHMLSKRPEPTNCIYTDAVYLHHTQEGATATAGPTKTTKRKHREAPSPTSLEVQAIAEAIQENAQLQNITIRSDSQGALRTFRENNLPPHIKTNLSKIMKDHPDLRVTLEWVPGHTGIEGNELAHQLAREAITEPGPSTPWPQTYDPYIHRKTLHTNRTNTLLEWRENRTTLPSPSQFLTRLHSTLVRRAQTGTLLTPHITHHLLGREVQPGVVSLRQAGSTRPIAGPQATSKYGR
ncbi:uncharacterized protein ISCGN_031948 [Ixodes scapularis]